MDRLALLTATLVALSGASAEAAETPIFGPPVKLTPRGHTEPRTAVAANGHRLVITNRDGDSAAAVYISRDRGGSWAETGEPFPGQSAASIDVDVVTMPDGSLLASELDSAGLNFPSAVSADEGKTWTASTGSTNLADQDRQFFAVGPVDPATGKSTVYITFHNLASGSAVHNVFVAKSTDGGVSFGEPVPVALPGSDAFQDLQCAAGYPSSIAVNQKTGRVYAFYITRAAPVSGVDLGGCGASVFGPFEINIISATRVWVATSPDGSAGSWENSLAVDTSASGKIVAMQFAPGTLDNQGNVWVVHPESPNPYPNYDGAAIKVVHADAELTKWSDPIVIDPGGGPGSILHHISVGDPGKLAVAYMKGEPTAAKPAWYLHVSSTRNALSATPDIVHQRLSEAALSGTASELEGVCDSPGPGGLVCPRAVDNFGTALDADCRLTVTWPADNNDLAPDAAGTYVATQTGGPGLCGGSSAGATAGSGAGSGSGAPVGPFCRDTGAPTVTRSRKGVKAGRRAITISGRAKDRGCVDGKPGQPVTGTISRVEVAVARLAGARCAFLTTRGKAGRAGACAKPRWLRARGTNAWTLTVRGRLAKGSYGFFVRGFDRSGNVTPARKPIRFRVR